ncbi:MAG: cyclic nucleotide-binding domain-containing protein [Verrucomicrobiia bacterium]
MNPDQLKSIALLQGINDTLLDALAAVLEQRDYADGQTIFAQGDPGDAMFFLVGGQVRIDVRTDAAGTARKTLTVLQPGEFFGELCLFDQKPRSASALASGSTQLLRLSKADFDQLMSQNNAAGLSVLSVMMRTSSDRIRRLSSQVVVYDEIGKAIGESQHLQPLLDVVLRQLFQAALADWGLLLLKSQFSDELEPRSVEGLELSPEQKMSIMTKRGFLDPMLKDPRPMLARNLAEEEPFRSWGRLGFELPALLLAPILVEQRLLGVIALGGRQSGQFDLDDLHLVCGVARQAGQAILNALHREEEAARSRHSRQFVRF